MTGSGDRTRTEQVRIDHEAIGYGLIWRGIKKVAEHLNEFRA
jgi:hypothetical protein